MSIMHCHKHDQQYDSDFGECPDCEHEESKDERLSNVADDLRRQMLDFAAAVKRLAFEMPPRNDYTPKFVQMALDAERIARKAGHHQSQT